MKTLFRLECEIRYVCVMRSAHGFKYHLKSCMEVAWTGLVCLLTKVCLGYTKILLILIFFFFFAALYEDSNEGQY